MSTTAEGFHHQVGHPSAGTGSGIGHFFSKYVFSRDHKIIGLQFLFSTLIWFLIGGLLALGVRWQVAYAMETDTRAGQPAVRRTGRPDLA